MAHHSSIVRGNVARHGLCLASARPKKIAQGAAGFMALSSLSCTQSLATCCGLAEESTKKLKALQLILQEARCSLPKSDEWPKLRHKSPNSHLPIGARQSIK